MSEITLIEPQVKDKTRCNVYIDGRFYCGIKLEVAVKYKLKSGMQIDKEQLDNIQLETEKSQALDKALTHISSTRKTKKQVGDFLKAKGYTQTITDYVLEKLEEYKLVDDLDFCRAYIHDSRGKGRQMLAAELYKKGADRAAVDEALSEYTEDAEDIKKLLERYFRGKTVDEKTLQKGFKYLLSKGFSYDSAKEAISAFGDGDEDY